MINGELQKFANITTSIDYFLVEVTRDRDGNISITYNIIFGLTKCRKIIAFLIQNV